MSKLQDLLSQAAIIRDATEDKENTALRVGTMFVDFIQACLDILPQLLVDGNLTEGVPGASSFTLTFHTIDDDGDAHSNSITIPIVSTLVAGLMTPALKQELHDTTASVQNLAPRMTSAESDITNLTNIKLSYYDADWLQYQTRWTEANFNALADAISTGKFLIYRKNPAIASQTSNYIRLVVQYYRSWRQADIWLENGVVSVTWLDPVYFPSETQVNELNDRVEAVEEAVQEVYCTLEQYQEWVDAGTIDPDTKYYIYE